MSQSTVVKPDYSDDPSVPTGFDEEHVGLAPQHARVGANSNIRTQYWEATSGNWQDWASEEEFACASSEIGASFNHNVGVLQDLSNAFMRGQTCRKFRIKTPDEHGPQRNPDRRPEQFVLDKGSVTAAFDYLQERLDDGRFEEDRYSTYWEEQIGGVRFVIYTEEAKGVRTFSAMHLDQITPLSSIPKKWTVRRAMRAILAGQVQEWFVDGIYTDDYARDAAYNFQRGELEEYLGKARRIWENPSGWKVWVSHKAEDRRKLSFNCHGFDTNTVTVDLDAEAVKTDWLTCLRLHEEHPAERFGEDREMQAA